MQRRQVEGHEIVAGIEHLEAFLETSKIECESSKNKIPKFQVKNLKSLEVFLKQRLRINPDTQQMFLARDNKDRATALGNFPRSKKSIESSQTPATVDTDIETESEKADEIFPIEEEDFDTELEFTQLTNEEKGDLQRIPITLKRGSNASKELNIIVDKFKKLKTNLQNSLQKRFSEDCRKSLKLSKIFDNKYRAETTEEKNKEET